MQRSGINLSQGAAVSSPSFFSAHRMAKKIEKKTKKRKAKITDWALGQPLVSQKEKTYYPVSMNLQLGNEQVFISLRVPTDSDCLLLAHETWRTAVFGTNFEPPIS
jgi:hypothetical protein